MSFFSSNTTSKKDPWAPAAGALKSSLGNISGQQWDPYTGQYVADMNPAYANALQGMNQFGQAGGMGGQYANNMMSQGQDAYGQGMTGYQNMLSAMSNRGAPQFQFDTGTRDQIMSGYMPGLQSSATLQGLMGQRQLQSNLGQLTAAAGQSGGFGSNPLSKLSNNAASATALNNEGVQRNIQNMYMGAMGSANQAGMSAGGQNLANTMANQNALTRGYGSLAEMGLGMQGSGYQAGAGNLNMGLKAGGLQQAYDQAQAEGDLARWNNNTFGQQQFYTNQFNPALSAASAFGKTTETSNPSGFSNLMNTVGAIGSVYGMAGGASGLGSLFGMGGGAGAAAGVPLGGGFNASLGAGGLGGTTYGQQYMAPTLASYGI